MEKDFRVCLVKASLLWSLAFLIIKGVSSADEPKCEISCRIGDDSPKDEDTVDRDSFIPSHCSIKNDGNISRNMTWKEVNDKITPKPGVQCLVLKTGNSEKRVYFASPLTVARWGSPVPLHENQMSEGVKCVFKGRPLPQITWYKDGSNLKTFNHTEEVEKLQDNGIFKVTTTLDVPGREEFAGIYHCVGNNSLSGGWSSIKEPEDGIELFIKCPGTNITRSGPKETEANAFSNITLSCLVAKSLAEVDGLRVTWNLNQSDPLKTGGKYKIPAFEPISSCRRPFKLEIINVTADDEGVYSCHQTCKDSDTDVCKSSAQFELKVNSPPLTRTVFNPTEVHGNTSSEETEAPTVPPETETPVFPPSVQAVTPSKPERWLTPVLTVSVGVFVLLTSVVIFQCKKKRTYKGSERHEEDGEILL